MSEHPENWDIRFLVADQMIKRGAPEEAITLFKVAPTPPPTEEALHRVVDLSEAEALEQTIQFVQVNPVNAYGHQTLATIYEWVGNLQKAHEHREVANTLNATHIHPASEQPPTEIPEVGSTISTPAPPVSDHVSAEPPQEGEASALTETFQPPRKLSQKAAAILLAVIFHLALALLAALIVILPSQKEEPEIVAEIVAPQKKKQEMKKKNVVQQTRKTSSSSAAAAPMAQLMRANAVAKIALPQVTRTSKGPLGLGDADFGTGGFGSGSGGMGSGETMFGSKSGGALIGRFYDLKQNPNNEPTGITGDNSAQYYDVIRRAERSKFSDTAFSKYFEAPTKLGFQVLAIPTMSAEEGPAAFAMEKIVKPKGWLVHYKGRVVPPQSGKWRFAGYFDDVLLVFVNGRLVLDACWEQCFDDNDARQPFGGPAIANRKPAVVGDWVNLSGPFDIDILVGERPGGHMGGALMVQFEDEKYRERNDGSPIIPLFTTMPLDGAARQRVDAYPYDFHKEEAVFREAGRRSF